MKLQSRESGVQDNLSVTVTEKNEKNWVIWQDSLQELFTYTFDKIS